MNEPFAGQGSRTSFYMSNQLLAVSLSTSPKPFLLVKKMHKCPRLLNIYINASIMTMQHTKLVYTQGGVSASGPKGFPTGSCHHAVKLSMCSRFCITCMKRLDSCNIDLCLWFKVLCTTETWCLASLGSLRQPYVHVQTDTTQMVRVKGY